MGRDDAAAFDTMRLREKYYDGADDAADAYEKLPRMQKDDAMTLLHAYRAPL